jgi:hypothetical protein
MKWRRRVNSTVTLNAFFSLLLVILAAQFPCGHDATCTSRSTSPLPTESEENQSVKTREDTNLNNSTSDSVPNLIRILFCNRSNPLF